MVRLSSMLSARMSSSKLSNGVLGAQLLNLLGQLPQRRGDLLFVHHAAQNAELIAADTVAGADPVKRPLHQLGQLFQAPVAVGVPIAVVDLFEVVHIHHDHREAILFSEPLDFVFVGFAVVELGQRVQRVVELAHKAIVERHRQRDCGPGGVDVGQRDLHTGAQHDEGEQRRQLETKMVLVAPAGLDDRSQNHQHRPQTGGDEGAEQRAAPVGVVGRDFKEKSKKRGEYRQQRICGAGDQVQPGDARAGAAKDRRQQDWYDGRHRETRDGADHVQPARGGEPAFKQNAVQFAYDRDDRRRDRRQVDSAPPWADAAVLHNHQREHEQRRNVQKAQNQIVLNYNHMLTFPILHYTMEPFHCTMIWRPVSSPCVKNPVF